MEELMFRVTVDGETFDAGTEEAAAAIRRRLARIEAQDEQLKALDGRKDELIEQNASLTSRLAALEDEKDRLDARKAEIELAVDEGRYLHLRDERQ